MKRQKQTRQLFRAIALGAVAVSAFGAAPSAVQAQTNSTPASISGAPAWITQPLSLVDALNIVLQRNATILKAKDDLEASYGIVVQTRAILVPKIHASGNFTSQDPNLIEQFPFSGPATNTSIPQRFSITHESWTTAIQLTQSIYEGGRMRSAVRTARLTKEQALLNYQSTVADTLLATRLAYYDILLAAQQITVNEASVNLLIKELEDQQRRYDAGTVPRFNVLRAEVAVANARPPLIRARNEYRIDKNNLSNLLGYDLPRDVWDDIPLQLTGKLEATPYAVELPAAISDALRNRTELGALRKAEELQRENVVTTSAGYKPSIQAFAAYDWKSREFDTDLSQDLHGWVVGGQISWDIFDGMLTRGKVIQAKALYSKAKTDVEDRSRQIELEVRTAYSSFIEAKEVLDSQVKVQEQAEEALRLARARAEAGTGTQLDVLDAETSLTQARTTQVQALHDYEVARARLERAIGQDMVRTAGN